MYTQFIRNSRPKMLYTILFTPWNISSTSRPSVQKLFSKTSLKSLQTVSAKKFILFAKHGLGEPKTPSIIIFYKKSQNSTRFTEITMNKKKYKKWIVTDLGSKFQRVLKKRVMFYWKLQCPKRKEIPSAKVVSNSKFQKYMILILQVQSYLKFTEIKIGYRYRNPFFPENIFIRSIKYLLKLKKFQK